MTNEELLFEFARELRNGGQHEVASNRAVELRAELLRRLGAAVSASPQPRCPKCQSVFIQLNYNAWMNDGIRNPHGATCRECEYALTYKSTVADFAQFFAAAPQPVSGDAPKVEEIAAKVAGAGSLREIIEALRRYFPPASQTPTIEQLYEAAKVINSGDVCRDLFALEGLALHRHRDTGEMKYLIEALNCRVTLKNFDNNFPDPLATPASTALSAQDFWLEYYKSDPNFPPSEAACDFAEAYAAKKFPAPASTARTDGWVSVEERLPEWKKRVLTWNGTRNLVDYIWDVSNTKWHNGNPTHWRELPAAPGSVPQAPKRPTIVVLCGSTRFYSYFQEANYRETMAGKIVLSIGFYPRDGKHNESVGCTPEQKIALDELYFRKIELADEVLVLNVGGYMGESTTREVAYAAKLGKKINYLEAGVPQSEPPKEGE